MKTVFFLGVAVLSVWTTSCNQSEKVDPQTPATVLLENAKLTDFPLKEAAYTSIDMVQPEMNGNTEIQAGEIKIVLIKPFAEQPLSLAKVNFDTEKFTISPAIGEKQTFSATTPVTYTITSKENPAFKIHYRVFVITDLPAADLMITGFRLEKSKNPDLPADIEASRIEVDQQLNYIYLFVPVGTDFSNLTPTITFNGSKLSYVNYANGSDTSPVEGEYPVSGKSIDFKYPKVTFLKIRNASGELIKQYNVIVDVKNPIRFNAPIMSTLDVKDGEPYFGVIGTFTNQGNHPISYRGATYKDKIPVIPTNVIQAFLQIPGGGLQPGETSNVNGNVTRGYPPNSYQTTAVAIPTFSLNSAGSDLLEPSEVIVKTNIIN